MIRILTILFLLFQSYPLLIAQNISGTIYDDETKLPIPNASIHLGKRGVITQGNGTFKLKLKETDWEQNLFLKISHVGYHAFQIRTKQFNNGTKIFLIPQSKELQEVIVSSSARELVKKALDVIPQNYQTNDFVISGNFLQTVRRSKNDTVFQINYRANTQMSYQKNESKETEVELLFYKKTKSKTSDSAKYIHWRKDGKIIQAFDFVLNHDDFLNTQKLYKYQYTLQDVQQINGRPTYQIKFELKSKPQQYQGTIFIDEESLAIIAFDFIDLDAKESNDPEILKEEKSLLHGRTTYKKLGEHWFVDSLEYSKSTTLLKQLGYISIHYKTDSLYLYHPKLNTNFYSRLTSDIMMETLEENFGLPETLKNTKEKNSLSENKKKFNIKFSYVFGLQTPFNFVSNYQNTSKWNSLIGIDAPELQDNKIPMIQTGLRLQFYSFQLGYISSFNLPLSTSFSSSTTFEISRPIYMKNMNRPMFIRPSFGFQTMVHTHQLHDFIPSLFIQQKDELANEFYHPKHQIKSKGFQIGIHVGVHLTRRKSLEVGIYYHIPTQWSEELNVRKSSNSFFQNLFKENVKNISIPFQTFQKIENNFSFNLTYQL